VACYANGDQQQVIDFHHTEDAILREKLGPIAPTSTTTNAAGWRPWGLGWGAV
jgi:hypothetical protein